MYAKRIHEVLRIIRKKTTLFIKTKHSDDMVEVNSDKQSSANETESDIKIEEAIEIDSAFEDNKNIVVPNVRKSET